MNAGTWIDFAHNVRVTINIDKVKSITKASPGKDRIPNEVQRLKTLVFESFFSVASLPHRLRIGCSHLLLRFPTDATHSWLLDKQNSLSDKSRLFRFFLPLKLTES